MGKVEIQGIQWTLPLIKPSIVNILTNKPVSRKLTKFRVTRISIINYPKERNRERDDKLIISHSPLITGNFHDDDKEEER